MVNWVRLNDHFSFELLALPFFRERIFPGDDARLRGVYSIDTDHAEYASKAKDNRLDAAMRFVLLLDQWEVAISHFSGTSREPILFLADPQLAELRPFYPVIEQTGLQLPTTGSGNSKLFRVTVLPSHHNYYLDYRAQCPLVIALL